MYIMSIVISMLTVTVTYSVLGNKQQGVFHCGIGFWIGVGEDSEVHFYPSFLLFLFCSCCLVLLLHLSLNSVLLSSISNVKWLL